MDAAQRRNALLELGLPIVGMLVIHMVQGHYHRRIPFWSEARQVILSCIIGLLTSGLFEVLSPLQTSRLFLIGTWLVMPILSSVCGELPNAVWPWPVYGRSQF